MCNTEQCTVTQPSAHGHVGAGPGAWHWHSPSSWVGPACSQGWPAAQSLQSNTTLGAHWGGTAWVPLSVITWHGHTASEGTDGHRSHSVPTQVTADSGTPEPQSNSHLTQWSCLCSQTPSATFTLRLVTPLPLPNLSYSGAEILSSKLQWEPKLDEHLMFPQSPSGL